MSLFFSLENDIKKIEKKIILKDEICNEDNLRESYELYNKAIDMINNNCFTSAKNLLESAKLINNSDAEIINAIGLVNLLYCNFDKACEYLYKSNEIILNKLSQDYINVIISEDFSQFLEYYNLGIAKANEAKYDEAIEIFLNIINRESYLIEPYTILYLLYKQTGDNKKKEECLNLIKILDKDNQILNDIYIAECTNKNSNQETKLSNVNKMSHKKVSIGVLLCFVVLIFSYKYINPKLNGVIDNKVASTIVNKKYNEENKKESKEEDKEDNVGSVNNNDDIEAVELVGLPEDEIIKKAISFKKNKDYKEAISMYKSIIKLNESPDSVSESIYQVAILSENLKDYDEAIKYYNKYIKSYSTSYAYYDESYYNIAMIYYNNKNIEKSKQYLSELIVKDPKSIYNNSKAKNILEN